MIEALAKGGVRFGVFADNEGGKHPERWKKVGEKIGGLLFRWTSGCVEPNVIDALGDDDLEELLTDPADEKTGMRLRSPLAAIPGPSCVSKTAPRILPPLIARASTWTSGRSRRFSPNA